MKFHRAVFIAVLFAACQMQPQVQSILSLGTVVTITIYDYSPQSIFDNAFALVREVHDRMSLEVADSDLVQLKNEAGKSPVAISEHSSYVLREAIRIAEDSGFAFTPLIEPIVELWDIGGEGLSPPSSIEINKVLPLIDIHALSFPIACPSQHDAPCAYLAQEGMGVDLGGIAKGYASDIVADYLRSEGVERAILDFGGNIYTIGQKSAEQSWTIGIQDPLGDRGSFVAVIPSENDSIVSSGVYERYFEADGRRYHHLLNPRTGYPENNGLLAVTVQSEKSILADGFATALFLLGLEDGLALAESNSAIEAIFITEEMHIYLTSGLQGKFDLLNQEYRVQ